MDWIMLTNQEIQKDQIPPVCVHCGESATGRHNKTYEWYPEWINTFYWLGFFPGLIAEAFNRREKRVSLPVCDQHDPEKQPPSPGRWWQVLQYLSFWLVFTGLGGLIGFLATLSAISPSREDLVEKHIKLEKQQGDLSKYLEQAGFKESDLDPGQAQKDKQPPSPSWDLRNKARQLKEIQNEIQKVEKDIEGLELAEQVSHSQAREWYQSPVWIGSGIGALLGLGLLLPGAFSSQPAKGIPAKKFRKIQVQEISDDGVSLIGLDDGFVKALIQQRTARG